MTLRTTAARCLFIYVSQFILKNQTNTAFDDSADQQMTLVLINILIMSPDTHSYIDLRRLFTKSPPALHVPSEHTGSHALLS